MIGEITKHSNQNIEVKNPCYLYEYSDADGSRHLALNNAMAFAVDAAMIIDLDKTLGVYPTSTVINEFYETNLRYYHQHLKPTYYSRIANDTRNIAEVLTVMERQIADRGGFH